MSLTDAGAGGATGAGAAGAGAGGTATPVITEPASMVVPHELQSVAGAETKVVSQPQAGAGAASQPQAGAGAASQPHAGAGAASHPHAGAGASQLGAAAGSEQVGAPLHLAARLAACFAFSLASKPPPLQPASFLA